MKKRLLPLLVLVMLVSFNELAMSMDNLEAVIEDTADTLYTKVNQPVVGSVGGEWAVLGLARSDYKVSDQYYHDYYKCVVDYVKQKKGRLHDKKHTEYSRLILALTAIGKDPTNVGGYNLLTPLGDYEKTIWQGVNGSIWALMALDSGNYDMPTNLNAKVQATREMYIDNILQCQLEDGGFSLFGGTSYEGSDTDVSDPEITGMALQALAKYQYRDDVKKVIDASLDALSNLQNPNGGYTSGGAINSESCVQVMVTLCELGIPVDDERFVKNGYTLMDNLLSFYRPQNGFLHTQEGDGVNMMATEQAFYGLVAVKRMSSGKNSLYRMGDAIGVGTSQINDDKQKGLEGKHKDVHSSTIINAGKTFNDIVQHESRKEIEALAERGIINGKSTIAFDPEATVTRAELATIIIKSLGLKEMKNTKFTDVKRGSWYENYVGGAYYYGIIKGKSETFFDPMGTVTKEEAATMVAKATKLTGISNEMDKGQVRDMLAPFIDYVEVSEWAREPMALCYHYNILSQNDTEINPKDFIKRYEVAVMLYNLLKEANLI